MMNIKNFPGLSAVFMVLILALAGCEERPRIQKSQVTFTGPDGMQMSYNGKTLEGLTRRMNPGRYIFKFTAPGYKPEWRQITVDGKGAARNEAVKMLPELSAAYISCSLPGKKGDGGVKVFFNGVEYGTTPVLLTGLGKGDHEVVLSHPGYASKTVRIKVDDSRPHPFIRESLNSTSGYLQISGRPEGALLYIDDKLAGPVPFRGKYNAGRYILELRAPGYISRKHEVNLPIGKTASAEIILEPEPSTITVETVPANAVCFVQGVKRGTTPLKVDNLPPGNYRIELKLAGYDPVEEVVEVKAGSHEKLKYSMESGFGSVRLNIRPAGLDVFVDGKLIGRTRENILMPGETEPLKVSNLSPGRHTCRISHPRGKPRTVKDFTFKVFKNKTTECPVVEMWVADCELTYKNGLKEQVKLLSADDREVRFSLQPGIIMTEKRQDVSVRKLELR